MFVHILLWYRHKFITLTEVMQMVAKEFEGQTDLIEGFNLFLPTGINFFSTV